MRQANQGRVLASRRAATKQQKTRQENKKKQKINLEIPSKNQKIKNLYRNNRLK